MDFELFELVLVWQRKGDDDQEGDGDASVDFELFELVFEPFELVLVWPRRGDDEKQGDGDASVDFELFELVLDWQRKGEEEPELVLELLDGRCMHA